LSITPVRIALLLFGSLVIGAPDATSEPADCRVRQKTQDQQCLQLAEELEAACPGGQRIAEMVQCRELSSQIARQCTRNPCAPPKKARAKGKRGEAKAKGAARKR
jgi:hypothetical protein